MSRRSRILAICAELAAMDVPEKAIAPIREFADSLCHICGEPKDQPGRIFCSYPHPLARSVRGDLSALADPPVTHTRPSKRTRTEREMRARDKEA